MRDGNGRLRLGHIVYSNCFPVHAGLIDRGPPDWLENDRLDAVVALVFMAVTLLVIATSLREWALVLRGRKPPVLREAPFVLSALVVGD
jgi:hypothetical protein